MSTDYTLTFVGHARRRLFESQAQVSVDLPAQTAAVQAMLIACGNPFATGSISLIGEKDGSGDFPVTFQLKVILELLGWIPGTPTDSFSAAMLTHINTAIVTGKFQATYDTLSGSTLTINKHVNASATLPVLTTESKTAAVPFPIIPVVVGVGGGLLLIGLIIFFVCRSKVCYVCYLCKHSIISFQYMFVFVLT